MHDKALKLVKVKKKLRIEFCFKEPFNKTKKKLSI